MTKNQIDYQRLLEEKRNNLERNAEAHRSAVANEELTRYRDETSLDLKNKEINETRRANVMRERENQRSNKAKEGENYRHNRVTETNDLYRAQIEEAKAHETARTNRANESLRAGELAETSRRNTNDYATKLESVYNERKFNEGRLANERGNLRVNQQNADTAETEAATNRRNAVTRESELAWKKTHEATMEDIERQKANTRLIHDVLGPLTQFTLALN